MPKSKPPINDAINQLVRQLADDAKSATGPGQIRQDATENIIRKYLVTADGNLNDAAFEVVKHWYNYITVYFNALAHQLVKDNVPTVGADAVDLAFSTPLFGLSGNPFWERYHQVLLPTIKQDIIDERVLRTNPAKHDPGMLMYHLAWSRHKFIGQIVALVHPEGMFAQIAFEHEFRELMLETVKLALGLESAYTGQNAGIADEE